jgi:fructoselysine-6-P-deglycase FrlB-like protein
MSRVIAMERELPGLQGSHRTMDSGEAHIGDRVTFRIADVFLPEPAEVLTNLTADLEANGVVVEFSDSGNSPRAYALVRLTAQQSVLLPVTALRVVS